MTAGGVIQPTGTPLRIWTVHSLATNTNMQLWDSGSKFSTTGTNKYLDLQFLNTGDKIIDLHSGYRFPNGAVLYTGTNFVGATFVVSTEF